MPRGRTSEIGDTMVNANGYHNTRTERGWRLTHQLVAEKKLGRSLLPDEIVKFVDGDKTNLEPDNILVIKKNTVSLRRRKAVLEARIEDLLAELAEINRALELEKP